MQFFGEEEIIILLGMILLVVLIQVLYLYTLSSTIASVRPEFRTTTPGKAWLGLIPVFNIIWSFIINPKVIESVRADLEDRGRKESGDYGKTIGSIYPAIRLGGRVPHIGLLFSLAYLIVFIIWWVKIVQYGNLLRSLENHSTREDILD